VAARVALRELGPLSLAVARFLVASLFYLPVALTAARRGILPARADLPLLTLLGLLGVTTYYLIQFEALRHTTATNVSLLITLTPVWTALLGRVWLGERLTRRQLGGMLVALAGAVLVATGGRLPDLARPQDLVGAGLTLLNTLAWAVYTAAGRTVVSRYPPLAVTAWVVLLGTALLVPPAVVTGAWPDPASLSPATWAGLVYLGVAGTVIGYSLWYFALEAVPASTAAPFLWLGPVVTIGLSFMILSERPGAPHLAGGSAIVAGLTLLGRERPTPQ